MIGYGNALVLFAVLGLLSGSGFGQRLASGEDWPCFLGPRQDGISRETGILKKWPAGGPPRVWSRRVGNSYSAPVTARGRLVVFHRVKGNETLDCLDARTGKPFWSFDYPTEYEDRYGYNNGPRSSPAIDGNRVYAYGAEGTLTCLDFETGRLLWQRRANQEFRVPQGFFGAGTAPLIEEGLVLLNLGGPDGAGVVAFDKLTGKTVWKASNDGASYSTPITRTINGKRLAVFFTQAGLLVLEVKTGAEAYRFPFRSKLYESVNAASPVVVDDVVFLSATYGVGSVALRMGSGGLEPLWQNRTAMQNHWATSIYWQGFLYGMDGRHEIRLQSALHRIQDRNREVVRGSGTRPGLFYHGRRTPDCIGGAGRPRPDRSKSGKISREGACPGTRLSLLDSSSPLARITLRPQ